MSDRRGHRMCAAAFACIALTSPAVAQQAGALAHYDLRGTGDSRVELGKSLAELSGLAFDSAGRLLGHGDERAVIWRIDPADGSSTEGLVFTGKRGVLEGDFEDIQVVGDRVYLVTSAGDLLESRGRVVGRRTEPGLISSGLEGVCSVEGMAWDSPSRRLLLLCKQTRSKRWHDDVVILGIHPRRAESRRRRASSFRSESSGGSPALVTSTGRPSHATRSPGLTSSSLAHSMRTRRWTPVAGC